MERMNNYPEAGYMPSLEEEAIAQAVEVFGDVPEWYQENKAAIERTRAEQDEWHHKISEEIKKLIERLNDV